jgi:hypothetical protein
VNGCLQLPGFGDSLVGGLFGVAGLRPGDFFLAGLLDLGRPGLRPLPLLRPGDFFLGLCIVSFELPSDYKKNNKYANLIIIIHKEKK